MKFERETFYYSGQGVVMVGDYDASGNMLGMTALGNCPSLEISIDIEVDEHKESQTGQRATDLRKEKDTKVGVKLTCENFVRDVLAMFTRGSFTAITAGSATDFAMEFFKGKIMSLPHLSVSAVTITKGVTPLVAYVNDSTPYDYRINAAAGSVKFADTPTTAGLVDGDDLLVDYTYAAQAQVDSLTQGSTSRFLRFEGLNTADGNKPVVVEVFKAQFDPAKVLSLISDESVQSFELEGSALADLTRTSGSKYFRERLLR